MNDDTNITSEPSQGWPGPEEPSSAPGEAVPVYTPATQEQTSPMEPVPATPAAPQAMPAGSPVMSDVPAQPTAAPDAAAAPLAPAEQLESPGEVPVADPGEKRSSGLRRALIIGGATAAALLVLGLSVLAAIFAFGMFGSPHPSPTTAGAPAGQSTSATAPAGVATGTTSQSAVASATTPGGTDVVAVVTNADVYTARDPFEPLLEPLTSSTSSSSSSSSTTSTSDNGSDNTSATASSSKEASGTLTLVSISTDNGVRVAHLTLDGKSYSLSAGESIKGTPWEVLSVGSDAVVMLFGDEQITLSLGQGISK